MKRVRKKIWTSAEAASHNFVLLEGESLYVDNGTEIEHWIGLDGVRERVNNIITINGTPFNSLPAKCKINSFSNESVGSLGVYPYDEQSQTYSSTPVPSKIFIGPVDPGPSGLNIADDYDVWRSIVPVEAPTNIQLSLVGLNTIRVTWVDNSDSEDGFVVSRSQSFLDWDLDVQDGDTIALNQRIRLSGVPYVCTTSYEVGTPKTFDVSKFSASSLSFQDIGLDANGVTVGAGVQTYDITGNEYGVRFLVSVITKFGAYYSSGNPVDSIKTGDVSEGETQTEKIAGTTDLWAFWPMYDAGSPLSDSSGNNRTLSAQGTEAPTYQQTALETSDTTPYSILVRQGEKSWFQLDSIWSFGSQSWEIGYWFKMHSGYGVPGNGAFLGLWTAGSEYGRIALWTNNPGADKFQIQFISDTNGWSGTQGTFTVQTGVVHMVSLVYNHPSANLSLYVNGNSVPDISVTRNLSTGFSCNRFGFNSSINAGLNQYMQKGFVVVGSNLSTTQRADIYNSGQY
jgi:hypothetical protein